MSTVDKALSILDLFSESRPSMGASEIARTLDWDKSNVQRYVNDLAGRGFLEQDIGSKKYFLGPALNRLSIVRSHTHPTAVEIEQVVQQLTETTGETAHASLLVGSNLTTTTIVETRIRGTRVYIDPAAFLPLHATASGIACLSCLPAEDVTRLLTPELEDFTGSTPRNEADLIGAIQSARQLGFAKMSGTFERDVVGLASPVLDYNGGVVGAVAVAMPVARFGEDIERNAASAVKLAAAQISHQYGATLADTA